MESITWDSLVALVRRAHPSLQYNEVQGKASRYWRKGKAKKTDLEALERLAEAAANSCVEISWVSALEKIKKARPSKPHCELQAELKRHWNKGECEGRPRVPHASSRPRWNTTEADLQLT
eukprot:Sspe_Gene.12914::Locus_4423_Transcript_1_1_Confidence_1.000_Length_657::g.12914::m.12914